MDRVSSVDVRGGSASVSELLVEFGGWLDRQRGLAPVTVHNYCWNAGQFLEALPESTQVLGMASGIAAEGGAGRRPGAPSDSCRAVAVHGDRAS